ncbi:MAG: tetratricopeptide repeat protein, partial [Candidatus Cloacimonetes bacterium]|nr:tetratricopeptide repeat protein [Candidatus Cloacimonadota bacterium]
SFKEFNPAMRVSVLEKAYEKWNDEIIITPLLQAYEETDQQQKIPLLIRERLDKDLSVGDHLKTYLIASYFSNRDFLSILELKNICYELNNPDLLRFLFISALNLHNIDLMIESASYLESLDEIPADFLPLLYGYLGYAYYQKGQWQEALTNFCQTEDVELLLEIFRTLVDPEDIESKIAMVDFLSRYSEDCPENDTVSFISTYIYAIIGYKEEAFGYLNMLSPSFLTDKELYLPLAIAYLTGLDAVDKATTILEARKEQDPSIDEVMATYYYNKEADSLAYVYFKKILHEQEKPEIRVFMVTSILADEFEDTENILPLLEKSLTIYPDNPEVMNMIGYAIADNEITAKYGLAEELLTQALALDSENGMIWDSLAWLYFRQGKISEALNAMEVPLSEEIQHSEIAYHLGEIFLMLGREKEAREYLLLAVELDNDENAVQISRQLLEMMDKK